MIQLPRIAAISSCFPFLQSGPSASSFPLENILSWWISGPAHLQPVRSAWKALPPHSELFLVHILARISALSEGINNIDAPTGFSGAGLYCAHLSPTCSQVRHLKSVMAGVFTPKQLANATKEGFPPRQPVIVLNTPLPISSPLLLSNTCLFSFSS